MKTIKNYLFLLMAGAILIFSACDEAEEPFEAVEPEVPGQGFYNIHTYQPSMSAEQVVFKGSVTTGNGDISYGFQWYVKPGNNARVDVVKIPVGQGAHIGDYSVSLGDLPKDVTLVVCAFVEYSQGADTVTEIGDEIEFEWDL